MKLKEARRLFAVPKPHRGRKEEDAPVESAVKQAISRSASRPIGGRARSKFTVEMTDGLKDATINFGRKFPGKKVSEIVQTSEGRGYLRWMLGRHESDVKGGKSGFDPVLIDVVRQWLGRGA